MSTEPPKVVLQELAHRGIIFYQLLWSEDGQEQCRKFETEAEAVVEMLAIEERLRAAALAGQGLTVNPFGELKPFVTSRDVHYASLKLRPRGLQFRETIDDYIAAHTVLRPLEMTPSEAAKHLADATAQLKPFDTTVDQAVYEWIEIKKQIGDAPFFELLRAWRNAKASTPSEETPPPAPSAPESSS